MNWDTIIFNDITVGQIAPWAAGALALYVTLKIYTIFFTKKKVNLQHTVYFVCSSCQWEGHISKFGTLCPKCAAPVRDEDRA